MVGFVCNVDISEVCTVPVMVRKLEWEWRVTAAIATMRPHQGERKSLLYPSVSIFSSLSSFNVLTLSAPFDRDLMAWSLLSVECAATLSAVTVCELALHQSRVSLHDERFHERVDVDGFVYPQSWTGPNLVR